MQALLTHRRFVGREASLSLSRPVLLPAVKRGGLEVGECADDEEADEAIVEGAGGGRSRRSPEYF
jgi:hypothetical protein